MRGTSILLFLTLSVIAASMTAFSQSAPQPYSLKADRLGETLTQWTANNPRFYRCDRASVDDLPDSTVDPRFVYCLTRRWEQGQNFTYATTPLLTETAWFYKGSLYKVEMTLLTASGIKEVLTGLRWKFGKPAVRETTRTQNGFGVRLEQKRLTWTNRVSTLELTYSNAQADHPNVLFTLNSSDKDVINRAKQTERTKASSDM